MEKIRSGWMIPGKDSKGRSGRREKEIEVVRVLLEQEGKPKERKDPVRNRKGILLAKSRKAVREGEDNLEKSTIAKLVAHFILQELNVLP